MFGSENAVRLYELLEKLAESEVCTDYPEIIDTRLLESCRYIQDRLAGWY